MERLHTRVLLQWSAGALVTAVVLAAVAGVVASLDPVPVPVSPLAVAGVAFGIVFVLGVAYAVLRYRSWRYEVRADTLYIERGVLTRVETVVPYVRVQHVDSQRGPLERLLGLGTVVVYTAGSRGADVSIPGVAAERATALQERLRDLAIESEPTDAV
ncbi:membrane protein YdbS with pleckstrin-like domain [Halarchaeum rubridurum]|uniref:Membrane protein n=1 Tax=Halarchaeum rubridurum TaxID=489911 RepID=A0A830G4X8_9EURY|nr:PH domain-containing protein [Halarchaeum rubridurum]MBP1955608.1 membrane protein YdbS with pleckstrin-like domain [Halarchaeum rubridurum]GGM76685.1 membrane protein [Halarchaeum rubridurum]